MFCCFLRNKLYTQSTLFTKMNYLHFTNYLYKVHAVGTDCVVLKRDPELFECNTAYQHHSLVYAVRAVECLKHVLSLRVICNILQVRVRRRPPRCPRWGKREARYSLDLEHSGFTPATFRTCSVSIRNTGSFTWWRRSVSVSTPTMWVNKNSLVVIIIILCLDLNAKI